MKLQSALESLKQKDEIVSGTNDNTSKDETNKNDNKLTNSNNSKVENPSNDKEVIRLGDEIVDTKDITNTGLLMSLVVLVGSFVVNMLRKLKLHK